MKTKLMLGIIPTLIFLSSFVSSSDLVTIHVLDYDLMTGLNNSYVRIFNETQLEYDNYTDETGFAYLEIENGTKTIVISHSDYITVTNETNLSYDNTYVFRLQPLLGYSIMAIRLDDMGLNYAICIDNLTDCYDSNEVATLITKKDYRISLVPSETDITLSTSLTLFQNVVEPIFVITIIIIVIVGIIYVFKKNIFRKETLR